MSTAPILRFADARKLATSSGVVSGQVEMGELDRLAAETMRSDSLVSAEFEFGIDDEGYRYIEARVEACLHLQCQRCLGEVELKAEATPRFAMVWAEDEIASLPSRFEGLVVGTEAIDLFSVIEEELLLCMPLSPRHPEGECSMLNKRFDDGDVVESEKPNPFAVLAALKND